MKQKQVKTTPKVAKQTKTIEKAPPPKKVQELVEESDSEEEEKVQKKIVKKPVAKKPIKPKKVVVEEEQEDEDEDAADEANALLQKYKNKKPVAKKAIKAKKVVVEEPVEEEQEDEDEDAADEEVEEEENNDEEMEDDDNEGEEDNDVEEDEDNDVEEDEEEDDEAPSEEAIGSEEPTIPSKVKSGPIPITIPEKTIVHVRRLPKNCKQIDLVEAFGKYGPILQIHLNSSSTATFADIAFKSAKGALAAKSADKIEVLDSVVLLGKKGESLKEKKQEYRERCVYVSYNSQSTTENQIREHFESCGEITHIKLSKKVGSPLAFVTFKEKSSLPAALKLHNSVLNDANIKVSGFLENKVVRQYDESLTILVRNKQAFKSIDVAKLEGIFSKCGQINYIDIICKNNMLAFITFKKEESAENALKLSGETQQGIDLEIEPYNSLKKWTTVRVYNIVQDCTEEELRYHFARAGEISSVKIFNKYAIIRFEDSDGFCKSFLFHESFFKGNMIFIEPHSHRLNKLLPKHNSNTKRQGFKRPFENGNSSFKGKRPRTNNM